jgi:hypothetical protein
MRYDLLSPREDRSGKTRWNKVGAAFPRDAGGFSLVFDALPLPDKEGNVRLLMSEAKPRDEYQRREEPPQRQGRREAPSDIDDSIPF